MSFIKGRRRWFLAGLVITALAALGASAAFGVIGDDATLKPGAKALVQSEFAGQRLAPEDESGGALLARDQYFMSRRIAGTTPLDVVQAGVLRAQAAKKGKALGHNNNTASALTPTTFNGAWSSIGPTPIRQVTRDSGTFYAVNGRIGALAIRQDGTRILGAAQGGIWVWNPTTSTWSNKTDNLPSLATGSLAVAPSNDQIVYAGTGEGALSGDSYFGNGILKSTDGGNTWSQVSGDYFYGVSVPRLVVDPNNANHLYAAALRGRGGARRTSPAQHSRYGIWESTDGGTTWTLLKQAPAGSNGATDLELDPQNGDLYASFWGDAIYKSTNGGASWKTIMNGLPAGAHFDYVPTRFSISLSHPANQANATLYTGFDWYDGGGNYHQSEIFKSVNGGTSWTQMSQPDQNGFNQENVSGYCATQCYYDNVIEADPTNPNVVFAAGVFNYAHGAGGIFRSTDGGQTWVNLGYNQHPDFHALAFDPTTFVANQGDQGVLVGSDGGVWYSSHLGGRPNGATDPLSANDWQDLNANGLTSNGLAITQFTSIANDPDVYRQFGLQRFWGGSQDNGTEVKSVSSNRWSDLYSGDGGQAMVDPTDWTYVYGTYYAISPYRATDGGSFFFNNYYIRNGLNLNDRSEFYTPFVMNPANPNQLFLGTYRLYRADNAKDPDPSKVLWKPISGDLTTGCSGSAPNGGRACVISAIGVGGGQAVYTGSEEGLVYLSTNAQTSDNPTWTNISGNLPGRPVADIAVDKSNYRIAYAAFDGFNAGTQGTPGHVFKTTDGGNKWINISGNLPDTPVNSVILDPSYPNTLYVGTDVGAFVTYDGGTTWSQLGTGFPTVSIWQLNLDPSQAGRVLAAGTHGRGGWKLTDNEQIPAFAVSKVDAGTPVGPSSQVTYTLTLRNFGNGDGNGVTLSDPIPANTTYVAGSADNGGTFANGKVTWNLGTLAANASTQVHFKVSVANAIKKGVSSVTNDGVTVTSNEGIGTTGSPFVSPIAAPYAVSLSPAAQTGGARPNNDAPYHVTVTNRGFHDDSYNLTSTSGAFPTSIFASDCTTPESTVSVASGASADVCVKAHVPSGTADSATDTATLKATSVGDATQSASGTMKTIAVAVPTLLVDNDHMGSPTPPDVRSYYTAALDANNVQYQVWDIATDSNLPESYLTSFSNVVWFTGGSYPDPVGPYEGELEAFLNGGGHLFMSGQDILDQNAGTTAFFSDYVHLNWDGSENRNDVATTNVHGASGTITDGIGAVPLNHSILNATFEDDFTTNGTAQAIFTDDGNYKLNIGPQPDGLQYTDSTANYKVVFLAFPFEAYGAASDQSSLMGKVFNFFNS